MRDTRSVWETPSQWERLSQSLSLGCVFVGGVIDICLFDLTDLRDTPLVIQLKERIMEFILISCVVLPLIYVWAKNDTK